MNYIGMDIHKQFTVAVVKNEQGERIGREKFENGREQFQIFLKPYAPEETKIVMESTSVWEYLYELIHSLGYSVMLANPLRTRAIAESRIKTDRIDAEILADLLRSGFICESYIPPQKIRALREITRERRMVVKQKTKLVNRIRAILTRRGIALPTDTLGKKAFAWLEDLAELDDVLYHHLNLLKCHQQELGSIEERIHALASQDKNAALLMSLPGFGAIRAMDVVAELGEISRFSSADKMCSYSGLVPSVRQSGNTLRFGRLVKQASKILKHVFIEAA